MPLESVYAYTDYRKYLLDFYTDKKRLNSRYSYRVLAEKSGFKARDYLMRVMKGERNLSESGIKLLSKYFDFSEKQELYFLLLVQFNQSEVGLEKEKYYQQLSEIRRYGKHQKIERDQFEYLSSWHHVALRSLLPVVSLKVSRDVDAVGKLLDPPLTAKQVMDSIELLLRLGLLQHTAKEGYTVVNKALSTGDEIASLSVAEFHKSTMELAKRSIDKHPSASRDVSGVTMSISQNGFHRIKKEIQGFRKKIMAIASEDTDEDLLYQFNMHLFPLSRNKGFGAF